MKCVKCGTEFFNWPCPTCERNRLLAEQNRKVEEQNRLLAEQNRMVEEQNRANALYRDEQELEEKFKYRLEELFDFAGKRGLMPVYVYSNFSLDFEEAIPHELFNCDNTAKEQIQLIFLNNCLVDLNELTNRLKSDDRLIDGHEFGKCWTPKFKLRDIKQILNSHNADYVIMATSDETTLAIFPVSLISGKDSLSGYEDKGIKIGEFRYTMFLHDGEETAKVAQILSNTSKRFHTAQKNVKKLFSDTISEYIDTNPKPVKKPISIYTEPAPSIISRIISIIPALLAFPLARMVYEGFFGLSNGIIAATVTVGIAALLSVIFRTIFGVVTGILALVGLVWFSIEGLGIDSILFMILPLAVAIIIGILFAWILGKIDEKIHAGKVKKVTTWETGLKSAIITRILKMPSLLE